MATSSTRTSLAARISIVIIDDHELIRELLSAALDLVSDFHVVGRAESAEKGIELCAKLRPNVVLIDSLLPGQQGPEAVAAILAASPLTRVMLISGTINSNSWRSALEGGARGFLPKSASLPEMATGIRAMHGGAIYIGRDAKQQLAGVVTGNEFRRPDLKLTQRERDVLAGIGRGLGSKQIASNLGVSVFTVENHRRRISKRTGLESIASLTLLAMEQGLIPPVREQSGADVPPAKAADE